MKYVSDFKEEEKHLSRTVTKIIESIGYYKTKKREIDEELKAMYTMYSADTPEFYDQLPIKENLRAMITKDLYNYEKALPKPYFGKIVFIDKEEEEEYTIYIGKKGLSDYEDSTNLWTIDWRTPIAEVYYSDSLGDCKYTVVDEEVEVDLKQKTTFDIDNTKLMDVYDTDFIANDELLAKYLSKNKDVVLNEIIATIQQDQNKIIRMKPGKNIIVQGVAGSGKTTVALHRIAYLLYNYMKIMTAENVYIIASNKLFLNYITSMLPDLDVININEGTVSDVIIKAIKQYDRKFKCNFIQSDSKEHKYLNNDFAKTFEGYFQKLEQDIFIDAVEVFGFKILTLSDIQAALKDKNSSSFMKKAEILDNRMVYILENKKEAIMDYVLASSSDEKVIKQAKELFKLKLNGIFEEEVIDNYKNLVNVYRNYFKNKVKSVKYKNVFNENNMLLGQNEDGLKLTRACPDLNINDLCLILLILNKIDKNAFLDSIKHIVIDEAQDLNLLTYYCLKTIFSNATFTIVGDVMQNIERNGLHDWNLMVDEIFDKDIEYLTLLKSYRNTIEISDFAKKIVEYGTKKEFKSEPLVRHGDKVKVYSFESEKEKAEKLKTVLKELEDKNCKLNAIICKDEESILALYEKIKENPTVEILSPDMEQLNFKTYMVSLKDSKGLEFDGVVIWDFDLYDLESECYDYKLLYVAATRALHQLHVFSNNEIFNQ